MKTFRNRAACLLLLSCLTGISRLRADEFLQKSMPDSYSGVTVGSISILSYNYNVVGGLYTVGITCSGDTRRDTGPPGSPDPGTAIWGSLEASAAPPPAMDASPKSYTAAPSTGADFRAQNAAGYSPLVTFTLPAAPFLPFLDESRFDKGGDPVQLATGAEERHKRLFSFKGARDWNFDLTYNSQLAFVQSTSYPMPMGWAHNFQANLQASGSNITILWDQGRRNDFSSTVGTPTLFTCTEDGAQFDTITTQTGGGWLLVHPDQSSLLFNASGQLVTDSDSHGRALNLTYTSGLLSGITDPVSATSLSLTYDSLGFLQTLTDGMGATVLLHTTSVMGSYFLLTKITDQNSHDWNYFYDHGNLLGTVTDNAGEQIISNTNNSLGQVASQLDGNGNTTSFTYTSISGGGFTTKFTDRNGIVETDTFDSNYNELTHSKAGELTICEYWSSNRLKSVTDPLSHKTSYTYDAVGDLLTVTDPASNATTTNFYDSRNNLLTTTDALTHVTTRTYDLSNNLRTYVDGAGKMTSWDYDSNSQPTTMTLQRGGVFHYVYTNGNLTKLTDPNGVVTAFGYDGDGRLLYSEDILGNRVTRTYDLVGNLLTIKNGLNQKYTYAYDVRNRRTSVIDPTTAVTAYTYDNDGNVLTTIDALTKKTSFAYTPEDQLQILTDAMLRPTTLAYDNVGRLHSVSDPGGNLTSWFYDQAGQLASATDALLELTSFSFDSRGRLSGFTDPLLRPTRFDYDDAGRRVSVKDPLLRQTNLAYDSDNRLTGVTDPGTLLTAQAYDDDGLPNSVTSPASNPTMFTRDLGDRLTASTTAASRSTGYAYDTRGLLLTVTQPSTHSTTFAYDNAARLSSSTDPVGTITVTRDADGRVLTLAESGNTLSRGYDALGRLTSYTDGAGNLMGYQYDDLGRLTQLTYPGGKQVGYGYDTAGRLHTVTDWFSRVTTYSYDADGRMTQLLRPNGTKQVRGYDVAGQLTQITDYAPNGTTVLYSATYGYDLAGQLTNATLSPVTTGVTPNVAQIVDQDDRLLTQNGSAVSLDADGNLLSIASGVTPSTYTYDARNRLTTAGGLTYGYNSENRRVSLTDATGTTHFAVNPNAILDQVLVKTAPSGAQTFYVYGLGLLHEDTGGVAQYYHFDQRGDTVALTNGTGVVTGTVSYGVYGEVLSQTGTINTTFLFSGLFGVQTDSNGLNFNRARYYHPSLRRWLNADPIGLAGGINLYAYVGNNPISEVDPLGLLSIQGNFGVSAVLGVMLFLGPGPFGSVSGTVNISLDFSHLRNSAVSFNFQRAGMLGMGFAADIAFQKGIAIDWSDSANECHKKHRPDEISAHFEAAIPVRPGAIAAFAVDVNKNGAGGAKFGEGLGAALYLAAGVAKTTTYSYSVQDALDYFKR